MLGKSRNGPCESESALEGWVGLRVRVKSSVCVKGRVHVRDSVRVAD